MMMVKTSHVLLLVLWTQLCTARIYDGAERVTVKKTGVKYAGPMVYSNLPPPVVYFPSMPKISKNIISNTESSSRPVEYIPLPYQDLPVLIYRSKHHPPIHVVRNAKHGASYSTSQDASKGYVTSNMDTVASHEGGRGFGKYINNYDDYDQGPSESYGQISSYSQLPSSYEGYRPAAGYAQSASDSYSQLPNGYQNQDDRYNSGYMDNYDQSSDEYSPSASGYPSASYSQTYGRQYPRGYQQVSPSSYQSSYEPEMSSSNIRQVLKDARHPSSASSSSSSLYQADESYLKPIVAYPPTTLQLIKGYGTRGITHTTVFQPKPIFLTSPSSSNAVYIPRPPMKPEEDARSSGRYGGSREVGSFSSMSSPAPHIIYTGHPPIHVFPQPIIVKEPPKPSETSMEEEQGGYAQASESHGVTYGGYKDNENTDGSYDGYKGNGEMPYESEDSYASENSGYHSDRPPESKPGYGESMHEQPSSGSELHPSSRPPSYQSDLSSINNGRGKGYISLSSGNSYGSGLPYSSGGSYSPSYDLGFGSGYGGSSGSSLFGSGGGGGFQLGGYEGLKLRPSAGIMGRLTALGSSLLVRRPFGLSSMLTSYRQPSAYYLPPNFHTSGSSFVGRYRPTPPTSGSYGDLLASGSEISESYKTKDYESASETSEDVPYPQVNYKIPPTAATAAPYHQKPPIIIYQGIRPPVYVYGQAAQEKNDEEAAAPAASGYEASQETAPSGQNAYEADELHTGYHQPTFSQQESQQDYDHSQVQPSPYEATPVNPDDYSSNEQELQGYENNAVERADHPEESEEPQPPQDPTDRSGWVPINFPEDQKTEDKVEEEIKKEEVLVS